MTAPSRGIDAVIDKDLAAALLAADVGADALLILTDVPRAYIAYNTPEQHALDTVTLSEMEAYAAAGHFKAGSMGPKVAACLRFVRAGGTAVIASLTEVVPALHGEAGTRIVPNTIATRKPAPRSRPGGRPAKAKRRSRPPRSHPAAMRRPHHGPRRAPASLAAAAPAPR